MFGRIALETLVKSRIKSTSSYNTKIKPVLLATIAANKKSSFTHLWLKTAILFKGPSVYSALALVIFLYISFIHLADILFP